MPARDRRARISALPRKISTCNPALGQGLRPGFCRQGRPDAQPRAQLHNPGQVGLRAEMEGSHVAGDFIPAGLASLGIEADEVELAVMAATHEVFWPAILELLSFDTSDVDPELCPDLSRAP
jgi:hypothetical protein